MPSIKPESHQSDPQNEYRQDNVIGLGYHAVRPMPPNMTARIGVAQHIAARTAAAPPVAISERSFMVIP